MPVELEEIYAPAAPALALVREEVDRLWRSMLGFVNGPDEVPAHAGGKLLRPALCLMSAGAAGQDDLETCVPMAAAMEMFHLAALAHDDVIDGSTVRRGMSSLNAMWTNHTAVLGGDYLVARGVAMLASYENTGVVTNAVDCIRIMAEGELLDFAAGPDLFSEEGCLRLAQAKTASLFAVSCSTPCMLTGGAYRDALHEYGLQLGMAFQIVDDLLDLVQDEAHLGKPAGNDIQGRKRTLPILYLMEALEGSDRERFAAMQGRPVDSKEREWIAQVVEAEGVRLRVDELAAEYIDDALAALAAVPESSYAAALRELAAFVVSRTS